MESEIPKAAARISALLSERMRVKGRTLADQQARVRRRLPRRVRRDLALVVGSLDRADHPKLARQIDAAPILRAAKEVEAYLAKIDPMEALKDRILWTLGKISAVLILVFVVTIYVLWSRGVI